MGWQHGPVPDPPDGLLAASRTAWATWFGAWFASNWSLADLPVLRQIIALFDAVERGQAKAADRTELRQLLDSYGVTPKGRQDRRWAPPKADEKPAAVDAQPTGDRYKHLRAV